MTTTRRALLRSALGAVASLALPWKQLADMAPAPPPIVAGARGSVWMLDNWGITTSFDEAATALLTGYERRTRMLSDHLEWAANAHLDIGETME